MYSFKSFSFIILIIILVISVDISSIFKALCSALVPLSIFYLILLALQNLSLLLQCHSYILIYRLHYYSSKFHGRNIILLNQSYRSFLVMRGTIEPISSKFSQLSVTISLFLLSTKLLYVHSQDVFNISTKASLSLEINPVHPPINP